ncbi:LPS-assembly protein [Granulicella pectinivorans]|uniref:LPS-assembly protein n=2 Tax=Granulicella pectinivorans TaxID=474950 RepID=A0A1I6L1N8_9BACT|nr:LPS-assembly protein [Granulicella pectinivorans]
MNRVEFPVAGRQKNSRHRSLIFLSIMLFAANRADIHAQQVTNEVLPDAPASTSQYPLARAVPAPDQPSDVIIAADTQSTQGGHFVLDGNVVITYGNRTVEADHVEYDKATGDLVATGHLIASGGLNSERIQASHGTLNTKTQTGRFYDVTGTVGIKTPASPGKRAIYANGNPFIFTGRMVVKTGPQNYDLYDGTVTSCLLPKPDWLLSAAHFQIDDKQARASNSTFRLLNIPLLYFPYVTHSVDAEARQSGFLIPVFGDTSTKGIIIGEQIYMVINRSMDLTVGTDYFSMRGWYQMATFRYRGPGDTFLKVHYTGLVDRRKGNANQGGEDLVVAGRHYLDANTRMVADLEYLSSFIYRAAFTENFNQAVSTDIVSKAFLTHNQNGYEASLYNDRYQGIKRIAITDALGNIVTPAQQIRIFRVPSLEFSSVDHMLGHSGFVWDVDASASGLKRVQPNFTTSGVIERYDFRPELAYPLHGGGWNLRPMVAVRETFYSRSRVTPLGPVPAESVTGLNRADFEAQVDGRMPVIERTFTSGWLRNLFRTDFKHTVEPAFTFRYVSGIDNFNGILRFDDHDIAANTNELQYGVTQRLYLKPRHPSACTTDATESDALIENPLLDTLPGGITDGTGDGLQPKHQCGVQEWITWRVTQKHYFDKSFGGAVQVGRRNLFDSTLDLSGIAFLTEAREISPLVSRLRVRASEKVDVEWDFDLDTGAKKFTANNFFVDVHEGRIFSGLSYARLNAPGRAYNEGIPSATSDFSQMRVLLGYGMPTKEGLSVAANAGLDLKVSSLQYAALQTSYNWNCCGISVEYRKYELGSVRNENAYRFNFTLANVGTAGNLRRAERLF